MIFIDTVAIESRLCVFRFEQRHEEYKFFITPLTVSKIPSFTMVQNENTDWEITDDVPEYLKSVERTFNEIIVKNSQGYKERSENL